MHKLEWGFLKQYPTLGWIPLLSLLRQSPFRVESPAAPDSDPGLFVTPSFFH